MTTAYLSDTDFKSRTIMAPADVDALIRHRYIKNAADVAPALQGGTPVSAAGGTNTYTRLVGSWIADGIKVGQSIAVGGFVNSANNGTKTVIAVNVLSITVSSALVTEGPINGVSVSAPAPATPETKFADVVVSGSLQWVTLTVAPTAVGLGATGLQNFATIIVSKRTAGGAAVVVAQLDTTVTALLAGVAIAVPLVGGAPISAEDVLTVQITKTGQGAALPPFVLEAKPSISFVGLSAQRNTAYIEARLRKRYTVPFAAPVPEVILRWLAAFMTRDCYGRRGFNPASEQDNSAVLGMAETAEKELLEAADSDTGLFEIPITDTTPATSAVVDGGPYSYSEAGPYKWTSVQAGLASQEDQTTVTQGLGNGAGTT